MNKRFYTCNNFKQKMDESSLSYRLKSCDEFIDKTRADRLSVTDYRMEYNTKYDDNLNSKLKEF